eukprot:3241217-Prymnesium_polylepis.1
MPIVSWDRRLSFILICYTSCAMNAHAGMMAADASRMCICMTLEPQCLAERWNLRVSPATAALPRGSAYQPHRHRHRSLRPQREPHLQLFSCRVAVPQPR